MNNIKKICRLAIVSFMILFVSACGKQTQTEKEVVTLNIGNEPGMALGQETNDSFQEADIVANYDLSGYTTFYNLPVSECQANSDYNVNGIIYSQNDPDSYNMPVQCHIHIADITCENTDTEKIYKIPLTVSFEELYSSDNVKYSACITPAIEFADNISGKILPARDTKGSDQYSYGISFSDDTHNYTLNCKCQVESKISDYSESSDGNYTRVREFSALYEITVPKDYNNLLMKISPVNNLRDINTVEAEATTHYMNEEMPEGTILLSIN